MNAEANSGQEGIRLMGIIADEVGIPRNDGTPGCALYEVPFRLSRTPSGEWERVFLENWDFPPSFTSMHRPGIARIEGDRLILDGTTVEEVEKYHLATLKLVIEKTNQITAQIASRRSQEQKREEQTRDEHQRHVKEVAKRLKFD